MPITGEIQSLYKDKDKTKLIFPTTKVKAISDDDGVGLNVLLEHMVYSDPEDMEIAATPINADVLGGFPASDYATKTYVSNKIAEVQLEGSDVDLSGYVTKDELTSTINNINYPVDSVNGKTGAVQLSAADVGARPNTWTPTAADVGARPSSWLPTIAEIGAAPAGYGFGTKAIYIKYSKLDSEVENGLYFSGDADSNVFGTTYVFFETITADSENAIQTAYPMGSSNLHLRRKKASGIWGEWEWVNPPMVFGVEYRTTKRYNTKVVYTKLIDCGAYPANNSQKEVANETNATLVVGCIATGHDGTILPYEDSDGRRINVTSGVNTIICNVTNFTEVTGGFFVQLWYIKE